MFSQASKGLRCKALENAVRLLYHKAVRKAQRLPWSETALTVSEWFNVLSGVQRLALQGFGERREVIIPQNPENVTRQPAAFVRISAGRGRRGWTFFFKGDIIKYRSGDGAPL